MMARRPHSSYARRFEANMNYPVPPQIEAARQRLAQAIRAVEKRDVDVKAAPWAELEKSVIKLLGGPFRPEVAEHQFIALGLAAILGDRLAREQGAFWFPNREALEGAVLGFPDALIMLSPFGAVVDSLRQARLDRLDDVLKEIRTALASAKFSAAAKAGAPRLTPVDYQRLFDPGFVQFVSIDPKKAKAALDGTPEQLSRDIRDALSRAGSQLPQEVRSQLEAQLLGSLQRLEQGRPLVDQAERAPRLLELAMHLQATVASTATAPEELWQEMVMPLLFIGAPESFPPLEDDELEAFRQGVEPVALFAELVPYQSPAPEEGLLGAFPVEELSLPHPAFEKLGSVRLVKLGGGGIRPLLERFDEQKAREAVRRFSQHLEEKAGKPEKAAPGQLLDAAMSLLGDLKKAAAAEGELHLRRTTEAEALSDGALDVLRGALQGPRLIIV